MRESLIPSRKDYRKIRNIHVRGQIGKNMSLYIFKWWRDSQLKDKRVGCRGSKYGFLLSNNTRGNSGSVP